MNKFEKLINGNGNGIGPQDETMERILENFRSGAILYACRALTVDHPEYNEQIRKLRRSRRKKYYLMESEARTRLQALLDKGPVTEITDNNRSFIEFTSHLLAQYALKMAWQRNDNVTTLQNIFAQALESLLNEESRMYDLATNIVDDSKRLLPFNHVAPAHQIILSARDTLETWLDSFEKERREQEEDENEQTLTYDI